MKAIDILSIRGFRSIEKLENFALKKLNVLIGANGAGKSNFVEFFRMLRRFADKSFQQYTLESGGGDGFLFLGPKHTQAIQASLHFGGNFYDFELRPTAESKLFFSFERQGYGPSSSTTTSPTWESSIKDHKDQKSFNFEGYPGIGYYIYRSISSWTVYHFHDTSATSPMRREQSVHDTAAFRHDASNIAAFLFALSSDEPASYELIRDTIRLIAPFFDDFQLVPRIVGNAEHIRLQWRQKGSDFPFQPYQLSDGTIRFICLATALLQPNLPATVVIDEPELGLHPYAISMLADLIKSASERTQVIISTQSPTLLDYFSPEQVVVVNRRDGQSTFDRLDEEAFAEWLEDYSMGELWQKNVVRGGPASE